MRFCFVSTRRGSHFMTELLAALSAATAEAGHTTELVFDKHLPSRTSLRSGDEIHIESASFSRTRCAAVTASLLASRHGLGTPFSTRHFPHNPSAVRAAGADVTSPQRPQDDLPRGITPDSFNGCPFTDKV